MTDPSVYLTHTCRRFHQFKFNPSIIGEDGLTYCQRRIKKSKVSPLSGSTPSWWLCDASCPGPVPLGESYEIPATVPVSDSTRRNIGKEEHDERKKAAYEVQIERMRLARESRDATRPKCVKCGRPIYARANANQDRLALCLCHWCFAKGLKDRLSRKYKSKATAPKCRICGKPIANNGKNPSERIERGTHDKCQAKRDKLRAGHKLVQDHKGQDIVIVRTWR